MIQIKRAYDPASPEDGERVLVDRLWPRGVSKERLRIAQWAKDVSPSTALRTFTHHDGGSWEEFRVRYDAELTAHPETWEGLLAIARTGVLTLIYAAKDPEHNNAVALQAFLNARL